MKKIELYIKGYCPFSKKVVSVFKRNNIEYIKYDVTEDPDVLEEISKLSSIKTVPQLFVDGKFIGDSTKIVELDNNGELLAVLGYEKK